MLGVALHASLPLLDHLVAVDGRYASYPGDEATSSADEYGWIQGLCAEYEVGYTLYRQPGPWEGNEVEKRTKMFELAEVITTEEDWYYVLDADEWLERYPNDLKDRLANAEEDAAIVRFETPGQGDQHVRMMFRAIRGLHCETNHFTFVTGDDRILWGNEFNGQAVEPALDLRDDFLMMHMTNHRDKERHEASWQYYRDRDKQGLERGICEVCEAVKATKWVERDLQPVTVKDRPGLSGTYIEACDGCFALQKEANKKTIKKYGFDPKKIQTASVPNAEVVRAGLK